GRRHRAGRRGCPGRDARPAPSPLGVALPGNSLRVRARRGSRGTDAAEPDPRSGLMRAMRLDADARRLGRDAILGTNRAVWTLSLAVWLVILAVGSYLGRVTLQAAGAVSLAVTFALGLAYVASRGRRPHRGLGIAANGLLAAELLVYFASHGGA